MKQGVIAGVFRQKGAAPCKTTRAEKLQLSVFLPNDLSLDNGGSYRASSRLEDPGWYSSADLKERLFTNKSKRPGDDTKEVLRTDGNTIAWQTWNVAHDLIWQSCRSDPLLVFPGEKELTCAMYAQIGEEEQVISPPYTRTPLGIYERTEEEKAG